MLRNYSGMLMPHSYCPAANSYLTTANARMLLRCFLLSEVCTPDAEDLSKLDEGWTKFFQIVDCLPCKLILSLLKLALYDRVC